MVNNMLKCLVNHRVATPSSITHVIIRLILNAPYKNVTSRMRIWWIKHVRARFGGKIRCNALLAFSSNVEKTLCSAIARPTCQKINVLLKLTMSPSQKSDFFFNHFNHDLKLFPMNESRLARAYFMFSILAFRTTWVRHWMKNHLVFLGLKKMVHK